MPTSLKIEKNELYAKPSNFIWYLISFILLVIFIGLYFLQFQPSILQVYANRSKQISTDMVLDIEQSYNTYLNSSAFTLPAQVTTIDRSTCSPKQKFTQFGEKKSQIEQVTSSFAPKPAYESIPSVYGFSSSEIDQFHRENYQSYQDAFSKLRLIQVEYIELLSFLEFRNTFIETCADISESLTNQPVVNACKNALLAINTYNSSQNDTAKKEVTDMENKCKESQKPGFVYSSAWLYDFLQKFNALMNIDTSELMVSQKTSLSETVTLYKTTFTVQNAKMEELIERKKTPEGSLYILDVEL
jgi:hypothetical protein